MVIRRIINCFGFNCFTHYFATPLQTFVLFIITVIMITVSIIKSR
ncbi:hypothetical protein DAY22_11615 [Lactiplantibacillus plantarum]|nr:hypothetical protein DAY22_11615 [Lactiplantibacillus plantarum]